MRNREKGEKEGGKGEKGVKGNGVTIIECETFSL